MDEGAIDRAMRRPRRYWYEDGIAEIATGIVFLLVALVFFAEASRMVGRGFSAIGLIIVVFFGVQFVRLAVRATKARLIYPRTGEVTYRKQRRVARKSIIAFAAAAVIAAVVALGLLRSDLPLTLVPIADGLLIGAFIAYLGHAVDLKRFYVLAVVSLACGMVAGFASTDDIAGSAIYFGLMGGALLIAGGSVLWNRLRRQPTGQGD